MQNDDKKILLVITSVNEVKESSEKSGSSSDPSQKLSMIKTWWQHRSVFEKEFCGFVALPTLLTCSNFALVASPMYESDTQFAIKDVVEQRTGIDIASQIFKTSSSSVQNARIVEAYLQSPDLFNALDRELKMVEHYSSTSYDLISRLSKESTARDIEVL